jgi:hypothetical protein
MKKMIRAEIKEKEDEEEWNNAITKKTKKKLTKKMKTKWDYEKGNVKRWEEFIQK